MSIMSEKYTTKTASIKATRADVRKLDAKEIKINGENILDKIKSSKTTVLDERGTNVTPYDLWGTRVETADDGTVTVYHELIDASNWRGPEEIYTNDTIAGIPPEGDVPRYKVKDNVLYKEIESSGEKTILANIQTNMLKKSMVFGDPWSNAWLRENTCITSWDSDLSNLVDGSEMFIGYYGNLENFNSDLSNLENGSYMFYRDTSDWTEINGGSWDIPLPKLNNGHSMFLNNRALHNFNVDLPNLIDGEYMFYDCGLESFSSDLSSLLNGRGMFFNEHVGSLTSFSSDLSSLTNGENMFHRCKLDAKSVSNIVQSLPMGGEPDEENTYEITIGIGCDNTEEDRLLFAQECHCDTWQELLDEFSAKNWTVTFQYEGRPTTTYNMRRGETLPIFVKVEEVIMPTEEEKLRKPRYSHTSLDGSKFYRLTYFHSTNGSTDGYTQFNSIEEAEQHFEITPKQQIEK